MSRHRVVTIVHARMGSTRLVTIVQARMGSTRLPGKALEGRPMLERQLERLARARTPGGKTIETTTEMRRLDIEALTCAVLKPPARNATEPAEREHVTRFLWRQPEGFRLGSVTDHDHSSPLRLTVDTPEDRRLVRCAYEDLPPSKPAFALADVLNHAELHPCVHGTNAHVSQKAT